MDFAKLSLSSRTATKWIFLVKLPVLGICSVCRKEEVGKEEGDFSRSHPEEGKKENNKDKQGKLSGVEDL